MLELRGILSERLKALGVFSGIAVAAVSGFELVISGALDPITPGVVAEAPSEYNEETVMRAWHYRPYIPTVYVTETSQHLGYPIDEAAFEHLAGGPDDAMTSEQGYDAPDDDQLAQEIERLYEETQRIYRASYTEAGNAAAEARSEFEGVEIEKVELLEGGELEDPHLTEVAPFEHSIEPVNAFGSASP